MHKKKPASSVAVELEVRKCQFRFDIPPTVSNHSRLGKYLLNKHAFTPRTRKTSYIQKTNANVAPEKKYGRRQVLDTVSFSKALVHGVSVKKTFL